MSFKVEKDTDPHFANLGNIIKGINGRTLKTGYIGNSSKNKRDGGKADNLLLAMVHNLGSPQRKIKARPTLAPAFDKNTDKYVIAVERATNNAMIAKDINVFDKQFGQIGEGMKEDVKKEIRSLKDPALSKKTIDARRRSLSKGYAAGKDLTKPLIWSGKYLESITYQTSKK